MHQGKLAEQGTHQELIEMGVATQLCIRTKVTLKDDKIEFD